MSTNSSHDPAETLSFRLGLLQDDPEASEWAAQHLSDCADCCAELQELRETSDLIDGLPPELFLEGPPDADFPGEFALEQAVRRIRLEDAGRGRGRRIRAGLVAAAAAAAVLAAFAGGTAVGRGVDADQVVAQPAAPTEAASLADTVVTGTAGPVSASFGLTVAADWVRVETTATGIEPGRVCEVIITAVDGTEHVAGSWVVSSSDNAPPAPVLGSAAVTSADVAAVGIRDASTRQTLITVPA